MKVLRRKFSGRPLSLKKTLGLVCVLLFSWSLSFQATAQTSGDVASHIKSSYADLTQTEIDLLNSQLNDPTYAGNTESNQAIINYYSRVQQAFEDGNYDIADAFKEFLGVIGPQRNGANQTQLIENLFDYRHVPGNSIGLAQVPDYSFAHDHASDLLNNALDALHLHSPSGIQRIEDLYQLIRNNK